MKENYVVYGDVVFLISFCLDALILWATAKFGQLKTTPLRLCAGALAGALYTFILFFPSLSFCLSIWGKLLFPVLMVLIAYPGLNWKNIGQALGYLYLVAFAMAGAMLGGAYLFNQNPGTSYFLRGFWAFLDNVKYTLLLTAVAVAFFLARWGAFFIKRSFWQRLLRVPVIICFGEARLPVQALVDTGNQLRDSLTQKPVMVTEYEVLKPLLPPQIQENFERNPEPNLESLVASLRGTPWASRFRLLPYASVGRERGILLGFRPDAIIVVAEEKPVKVRDVVIGIYPRRLSPTGEYRALLHLDLLAPAAGF